MHVLWHQVLAAREKKKPEEKPLVSSFKIHLCAFINANQLPRLPVEEEACFQLKLIL